MYYDQTRQIQQKFLKQQKELRAGPVQLRSCRDICCLLTFIILFLAFIAIGSYYLVVANSALNPNIVNAKYFTQPLTVIKEIFVKYWPVVIGMFGLSLVLSVVFLCLVRYCTKCMVYTLIISTILIMLGIIGISIVSQAWGTLISTAIGLLLFLCLLFCYRKDISRGITLLKATMQFVKSRPSVFLIPLALLILALAFLTFWIITLICMQNQSSMNAANGWDNAKEIVFYIFWIFMIIFFAIFLYYVMVFLVAYMVGKWYYGHRGTGCCSGFGVMNRAHIGSLTFTTLMITIVKIVQYLGLAAYQNQSAAGNSCAACCLCCLSCCFAQIQYIVEVLNKYAVIAMSLTGQGYISSAKTALSVIFRDMPLFIVTNGIGELIKYGGIVLAAGIPTLLGYLLIHAIYIRNGGGDSYEMTILILLLFLICLFLSYFFVTVLSIALSAFFFFFCLDRRYRDMAVTLPNTPGVIHNLEMNPNFVYRAGDIPLSSRVLR